MIQHKTRMKGRKRLSTFQREILRFTLQIQGIKENTDESDNSRSFFIQMLKTFWRRDPAYTDTCSEVLQNGFFCSFSLENTPTEKAKKVNRKKWHRLKWACEGSVRGSSAGNKVWSSKENVWCSNKSSKKKAFVKGEQTASEVVKPALSSLQVKWEQGTFAKAKIR